MRKKIFKAVLSKGAKVIKKVSPEFREAVKKHNKLLNRYKNRPLDKEAVRESYRIFTKSPGGKR